MLSNLEISVKNAVQQTLTTFKGKDSHFNEMRTWKYRTELLSGLKCTEATRNDLSYHMHPFIHPHLCKLVQYPGAYFLSNSYVKRQKVYLLQSISAAST